MQTAFLGDLLLTIPLFRHLRRLYPEAPLWLVSREGVGRLIRELGLVDQIFEVKKKDRASYASALDQLSKTRFSMILCPHPSMNSAQFCWRIAGDLKISFKKWWNFPFFKVRVEKDMNLPEALRHLSLLSPLDPDLAGHLQEASRMPLKRADREGRLAPVPDWASLDLSSQLRTQAPPMPAGSNTICLFPGSVWKTKQWSEKGYAELGRQLVSDGFQIYWLGSKEERELTQKLQSQVPGSRSVAGELSLMQSLILLSHSRMVVCNDSAGQHLAAVAGVRTVSIFGPTVLAQGFRPWNSRAVIAELVAMDCRPCGAHGHHKCPLGHHNCMQKLPASLVHQRVQQINSR